MRPIPIALAAALTMSCAVVTGGERNPRLAEIHVRLGVNELYLNRAPKALEELLKALKYDPDNAEVHYTLGFAYQGRRFLDKAVEHLKKAIELRASYSDAYNNLGTIYLDLERYDEAIAMFRKALANVTYATPYLAYGNLGWAYHRKGEHAAAAKHLKTAVFHNPKFCQGHNNLGVVYQVMGEVERATEHLEAALKYCPKYVEAHYRLGVSRLRQHKIELASSAFRECETLAPDSDFGRQCKRYLQRLR